MAVLFALGSSVNAYADTSIEKVQQSDSKVEVVESDALHIMAIENDSVFDIDALNIGAKTAQIRWSDDENYSSYCVIRYNEETGEHEKYAVTDKNYIKLKNLTPKTEYKFIVATALGNKNLGVVGFKTSSLVATAKITDVASKFVKFSIKDLSKGAYVEIYRGDSKSNLKLIGVATREEYIDENVKPGKRYYYKTVAKTPDGISKENKIIRVSTPISMGLPSVSGSTKTYAHYTAVTAKSTAQYKLLNSKECYTDPKTGIRMVDDCYCVALGSYYGSKIGTKYRIEFSTGKSIKVILCDQKSNRHTDSNNQYAVNNCDIIEFYVQRDKIPKSIRGNYGNLAQFEGSIVSIEKYV